MRVRYTLLAAIVITAATSAAALAQRSTVYDPTQLPEIKGKVAQYLLTARGNVEGLILMDGTEVYVAPRLANQLVFAVRPGESVTIHGLAAKAVRLVLAASVTNDTSGTTVAGNPRRSHEEPDQIEAVGRVKEQLHSPRGYVDGVLLEDGTIVRLSPSEVEKFASQLTPGQTLFAQGYGSKSALGKIIAARALGADKEHTQPVASIGIPKTDWLIR